MRLLAADLGQRGGEPVQGRAGVVPLALHRLDPAGLGRQSQDGADVPPAGLALELGQARRAQLGLLQDPDDPVDLGVAALDPGDEARQGGDAVEEPDAAGRRRGRPARARRAARARGARAGASRAACRGRWDGPVVAP